MDKLFLTYIKILFFCHWWLTHHYLDTLNSVLSVQILSICNCPGKRHDQNRRISIYSLMTNKKKATMVWWWTMMKSKVERRLRCPLTSADLRSTELLTQMEKAALKRTDYLFIWHDCHFPLCARLYNEKCRFPLFASMIAFDMQGAAACTCTAVRRNASPPPRRRPLRNYHRTVVQFWNRQYCYDARSQWPLLLIIQPCAHQRVIFACATTRERFFSTLHFFRDKCVCACKSGYFQHFMHLLNCVVRVKQL